MSATLRETEKCFQRLQIPDYHVLIFEIAEGSNSTFFASL